MVCMMMGANGCIAVEVVGGGRVGRRAQHAAEQ